MPRVCGGSAAIDALRLKLKLELESELMRKPPVEETPEMDVQVWSKLPEELLVRVLSHLPTLILRKFKIVCKSWRTEFQRIHLNVPLVSIPAFLIGGLRGCMIGGPALHDKRGCWYRDSVLHHLYLLQSLPTYPLRKLTLDFLGTCGTVVTTCKSLFCYRSERTAPNLFFICNPITRTWIKLPPPIQLRSKTDFIAMAFDPCARRCLLVRGVNNNTGGHRNQLVMEIYDSQSYTWAKSELNMPLTIYPKGEGVYSRGIFYWISHTPLDQSMRPKFRPEVVAYNVAEKRWDVIRKPQAASDVPEFESSCCWKLTGYDGKVVLVDQIGMSLWKLDEDGGEGHSWSELMAFPRSPFEETVSRGNKIRANRHPDDIGNVIFVHPQIVMNSCGWLLVYLPRTKLVVFDAEGRMMRSIEGKLAEVFGQGVWPSPLRAYEINNVWWP